MAAANLSRVSWCARRGGSIAPPKAKVRAYVLRHFISCAVDRFAAMLPL